VMYPARADARKAMTSAISSGCDARRIGVVSPQRGDERGAPGASACRPAPGAIALTRTPLALYSAGQARVIASRSDRYEPNGGSAPRCSRSTVLGTGAFQRDRWIRMFRSEAPALKLAQSTPGGARHQARLWNDREISSRANPQPASALSPERPRGAGCR
jgi:hypothetical protein